MVDGESHALPELGAGIAEFIVVLAFLAVRNASYVLIDEPELHLHPSLQVDFLTSISARCEGAVVFSTHNIGLARMIGQQVYVVQKLGSQSDLRLLAGHPRLSEVLGELSFSGYQEIGFSKLLLVEGPTDVVPIREFLRQRGKDRDVVILPLGGATLINGAVEEQLHELKRITPNITAVVDSERPAENSDPASNVVAFEQACIRADIKCHILQRRALEHYLSEAAIQRVKGLGFRSLAPFERREDCSPMWSKAENGRIARAMYQSDLENTDLGEFLDSL